MAKRDNGSKNAEKITNESARCEDIAIAAKSLAGHSFEDGYRGLMHGRHINRGASSRAKKAGAD